MTVVAITLGKAASIHNAFTHLTRNSTSFRTNHNARYLSLKERKKHEKLKVYSFMFSFRNREVRVDRFFACHRKKKCLLIFKMEKIAGNALTKLFTRFENF